MLDATKAYLLLENGLSFDGYFLGAEREAHGEVVFNTATTGYQEIITDPSYRGQIVCFTSSHIGNTGINQDDHESAAIQVAAVIAKDIPQQHFHWQAHTSLVSYLKSHEIPILVGIDTRKLVRVLAKEGSYRGIIRSDNTASDFTYVSAHIKKLKTQIQTLIPKGQARYTLVVYDFGIKQSILNALLNLQCRLIVVPSDTDVATVLSYHPDGIVLSNGPGDPRDYMHVSKQLNHFLKLTLPILGICLGHQLLALASGAQVKKLEFGHHGANHPVQALRQQRIYITSQNHHYVVAPESLPTNVTITHISAFDGSIQGLRYNDKPIISFQGHPEGGPGPTDIYEEIFSAFLQLVKVRLRASAT